MFARAYATTATCTRVYAYERACGVWRTGFCAGTLPVPLVRPSFPAPRLVYAVPLCTADRNSLKIPGGGRWKEEASFNSSSLHACTLCTRVLRSTARAVRTHVRAHIHHNDYVHSYVRVRLRTRLCCVVPHFTRNRTLPLTQVSPWHTRTHHVCQVGCPRFTAFPRFGQSSPWTPCLETTNG